MGSKKPEPATRDGAMTAVSDAQLTAAAAAYNAATDKLYNLLLQDNNGAPIAALGALAIFRVKCEQHILRQLSRQANAGAAKRRRDGRGHGRNA